MKYKNCNNNLYKIQNKIRLINNKICRKIKNFRIKQIKINLLRNKN